MSDQTSNRNDVASRRLHIPFEDVIAVIFGLSPSIIDLEIAQQWRQLAEHAEHTER